MTVEAHLLRNVISKHGLTKLVIYEDEKEQDYLFNLDMLFARISIWQKDEVKLVQ
jgi:hypothetical protein